MIITRAPFRVSFCGGGSDIPSFYEKYGGCVLSTTIRKYMYLTIHNYFHKDRICLKYSNAEEVSRPEEIQHKYFRQCVIDFNITGVEITSMADIPAGTGLGSSSSFTVALLHLLHTYKGEYISKYKLAKDACEVEIGKLGEPIGKQDQFAAAFGGLNFYEFQLERNLLMFYLGGTHSASEILKEQKQNITDGEKVQAQLKMCGIARELKEQLQNNNVDALGGLLHQNWELKKTLASEISNPYIDKIYDSAIAAGATGGKLLGAGGAGFLIFYVPDQSHDNVRQALADLREMDFTMDNSGASIIYVDRDFG